MILRRILLPVHFNSLFQSLWRGKLTVLDTHLSLDYSVIWAFMLSFYVMWAFPLLRDAGCFKSFLLSIIHLALSCPLISDLTEPDGGHIKLCFIYRVHWTRLPFILFGEPWLLLIYFLLFPFVQLYISTRFIVCQ